MCSNHSVVHGAFMAPSPSYICAVLRLCSGSYPCQILHSLSWKGRESEVYAGAHGRGALGVAVSQCRLRARSLRAGAAPCAPGRAGRARAGLAQDTWLRWGSDTAWSLPGHGFISQTVSTLGVKVIRPPGFCSNVKEIFMSVGIWTR